MIDIQTNFLPGSTCVVGFASMGEDCGGGIPPFEWARTFHDLGVATVLMRDRHLVWYQRGVEGVGNLDAVALYVRGLRQTYSRVITVGISMGGYAAILFGVLGHATDIIAMSPQTRLSDDSRWDGHWRKYVDPVVKHPDLHEVTESRYQRTEIIIGDKEPADLRHAENIKTANIWVLPDCGHSEVGTRLRDGGFFKRLIHERHPVPA